MSISLHRITGQHAREHGSKRAVSFEQSTYTYQQWHELVEQMAQVLWQAKVRPASKVALLLENCVELLGLYWAVTRIGAAVVPLSPLLRDQGVLGLAKDAQCALLICADDRANDLTVLANKQLQIMDLQALRQRMQKALLEPVPEQQVLPSDLFNIVYSSGTTGLPKGIMHSHHVRAMYGYCFSLAFGIGPESVILHAGSLVFNGAFVTMMPCFLNGGHFVFTPAFEPNNVLMTMAKHAVTHTMMVPSQIICLLENPNFSLEHLPSVQMILVLGAPLQQHFKAQLQMRFPNRFFELYGLTEGFITVLHGNDAKQNPRSVGCPLPGSRMRIVGEHGEDLPAGEIGEIVGDGPLMSSGYFGREDLTQATFRDGWIFTGDLGYQDEQGFLYLVDRQKDLIISGGVNVYPSDIEEIMVQHPLIQEAAVVGVAHKKWGETPVAAVVVRAVCDATELCEWVNQRVVARYQKLSQVYIIEAMPRNVAGKTLKQELRVRFATS
ncbi:MAG: acyl--CoA ligase [Gammaproteobacteria bacterium]|jgi:acyl-CoA synthetase (AMP-forming)/AMP-acid ligase II|nr:acyl--CoA ligase [Gammaproteobacteria bacterium]